jgi:16S rRNA (guanine527-N7)-methyltransferase
MAPGGPAQGSSERPTGSGAGFGRDQFRQRFDVSRETLAALETYADLLVRWQRRINLVADSTVSDLWWRHLADSAQIVAHIPDTARVIADVGSGAGFPGLVVAMMRPMFHVKLIESNSKKAAFLQEVAARTGATNVGIIRKRVESLTGWSADVITARACASLTALLEMTETLRRPDTLCLFLKGATAERELTEAREAWNMTVQSTPSLTSPDSVLLKLSEVSRVR